MFAPRVHHEVNVAFTAILPDAVDHGFVGSTPEDLSEYRNVARSSPQADFVGDDLRITCDREDVPWPYSLHVELLVTEVPQKVSELE